jgi:small subunit ribosomal protein S1
MTVEVLNSDQQQSPEKSIIDEPFMQNVAPEKTQESIEPAVQPGRVVKREDLPKELVYPQEELEVLTRLYDKTITEIAEGTIVTGKILSITNKEIAVDIGFKSEGVIPIIEFRNPEELKVGDTIEVYLDRIEDSYGQLKLSKEKADFTKVWEKVIKNHETGELVEGKCVRRIKGGIVVDINGIDAFLPGSQIDVKPIRDFDALIGQIMEFRIVKVNHLRKNIVVSRRVIIEEGLSEQREKMLKELEKGQVRWGGVKNITDFGVFIDLGGVDGLLHITDLSWGRVSHPSEIVSLDQKIQVVVLDFDKEKQRVSLGLKQLQPHPWENIEEKYPVGARVTGRVVSITDYGAFVELEKGIEGLIHISEMSWTQHIKHPSKILSIGEEIEAVVLNFDKEEKKISLGLKQIEPDPWSTVVTKYPIGTRHRGKVRNVTNFGVFVELEEGIDGLVHISDLSWTKKVRHPSEIVKKGEEIDVVILNVSVEDRRISLGHKQMEENPWDKFELEFQKGVITIGKVVRTVEKGLIVELPGGVEGFVPSSQLEVEQEGKPEGKTEGRKKGKKLFNSGDELSLKVIEFDKDNKKIVLSQSEYLKELTEQEVQEYLKKQKPPEEFQETPPEALPVETTEEATKQPTVEEAVVADETETKKKKKIPRAPKKSKISEEAAVPAEPIIFTESKTSDIIQTEEKPIADVVVPPEETPVPDSQPSSEQVIEPSAPSEEVIASESPAVSEIPTDVPKNEENPEQEQKPAEGSK